MRSLEMQFKSEVKKTIAVLKKYNWEDQKKYVNWLSQTYYFARTTTRLLSLVASHLPIEMEKTHFRFISHAQEEKNHELLLERDLKSLGYNIADLPESSITAAFYQTQYYWIQHMDPLSFFGYILILEGIADSFGEELYERVLKSHGKEAVSFIKVHAKEDKDHIQKALMELKSFPEKTLDLIQKNLSLSTDLYIKIIQECQIISKPEGELQKAG